MGISVVAEGMVSRFRSPIGICKPHAFRRHGIEPQTSVAETTSAF
jgi:hypothetical protein